jgi:hypothetical protein
MAMTVIGALLVSAMSQRKRPNLAALYKAATSARSTEPTSIERRVRRPAPRR